MFLYGVAGSAMVELLRAWRIYETHGRTPARYRRWQFWLARLLMALTDGFLAGLVYGVDTPVVAVHIGATTPAIVDALSRRPER
jgi:hypothetical protein